MSEKCPECGRGWRATAASAPLTAQEALDQLDTRYPSVERLLRRMGVTNGGLAAVHLNVGTANVAARMGLVSLGTYGGATFTPFGREVHTLLTARQVSA